MNRAFLPILLWLLPLAAMGQQRVKTGVYLMNVYDLNMDEHSYYADFYIWFRWRGPIDPTNIEFVNMVEKWGQTQSAFADSVVALRSGESYKIMRVEGRFFHSFSLGDFPLDRHLLDVQIENPDYPVEKLVYVPDTSHVRPSMALTGWQTGGCSLRSQTHDYGSDFGQPDERASRFSSLVFEISLDRPVNYFLFKLMLPLLVVMIVSLGALLIHPSYIDARISLPIGGLLTAVFLQQSYSSALPDTGYMVLMDKIYLLSYLLVAAVLWRVIIAGNWLRRDDGPSEKSIMQLEKKLATVLFAAFITGVTGLAVFS